MSDQPTITLTRDQARFLGIFVASIDGAASVDVQSRGDGAYQLVVYDKLGEAIATETMRPGDELTLP